MFLGFVILVGPLVLQALGVQNDFSTLSLHICKKDDSLGVQNDSGLKIHYKVIIDVLQISYRHPKLLIMSIISFPLGHLIKSSKGSYFIIESLVISLKCELRFSSIV